MKRVDIGREQVAHTAVARAVRRQALGRGDDVEEQLLDRRRVEGYRRVGDGDGEGREAEEG